MDQDFNEFKQLIELMESAPQLEPPERLSQDVMARLAVGEKQGSELKLKDAIYAFWSGRLKFAVSSPRECSYCFFVTGFFYFVMGLILIAGFKATSAAPSVMNWISLQPYFILGMAAWMIILGGILITDNGTGLKIVRIGTFIYIFSTVFNGIQISPYLHVPYAGIFLTGFIIAGITIGSILAFAVQILQFRTGMITQETI